FQAEDGIRDLYVTGVQTCALPILVAEKIIQVQPELAEGFFGAAETNAAGAVVVPGGGADKRDPGIRTILFTDIVESTTLTQTLRSEERRVGKECRSRWSKDE